MHRQLRNLINLFFAPIAVLYRAPLIWQEIKNRNLSAYTRGYNATTGAIIALTGLAKGVFLIKSNRCYQATAQILAAVGLTSAEQFQRFKIPSASAAEFYNFALNHHTLIEDQMGFKVSEHCCDQLPDDLLPGMVVVFPPNSFNYHPKFGHISVVVSGIKKIQAYDQVDVFPLPTAIPQKFLLLVPIKSVSWYTIFKAIVQILYLDRINNVKVAS